MSYKCFDVTVKNKIAHIVLNRPEKRNSMIPEFWDELPDIVRELDGNAQARVIVISSTGPHFTSGIDTAVFSNNAEPSDDPKVIEKQNRVHGAKLYDTVNYLQQTFTCLEECRGPGTSGYTGRVSSVVASI